MNNILLHKIFYTTVIITMTITSLSAVETIKIKKDNILKNIDDSSSVNNVKIALNIANTLNDAQEVDQKILLDTKLEDLNNKINSVLKKKNVTPKDKIYVKKLIADKAKAKTLFTTNIKEIRKNTKQFVSTLDDSKNNFTEIQDSLQNRINKQIRHNEKLIKNNYPKSKINSMKQRTNALKKLNNSIAAKSLTKQNFATKFGGPALKALGPVTDLYETTMFANKVYTNTATANDLTGATSSIGGLGVLFTKNPLLKKALAPVALADGVKANTSNIVGLLSLAYSDGTYEDKLKDNTSNASKWKVWTNDGKMTPIQMKDFYTAQIDKGLASYTVTMAQIAKAVNNGDKKMLETYLSNLKTDIKNLKEQKKYAGTYAEKWHLAGLLGVSIDANKINALNKIIESEKDLDKLELSLYSNIEDVLINKEVNTLKDPKNFIAIKEVNKEKPKFYAAKEEKKIEAKSETNPTLEKDQNSDAMNKLKETDKKLKTNIKQLANEKENLKSKEARLKRIRDEKRAVFNDVKNAEKGSDEYNYAKNRFFSLSSDYRKLNHNINALIESINMNERSIQTLEMNKQNLMSSIEDSIQDYNNDIHINIVENTIQTDNIQQKDWRGGFTFKAEEQSGKLVYTGGNWGTTEEHLQYGASALFSFETNNPDIVKNGHFEHGTNTAIDNTKQFDITASGSNTDIKTLNITQDVGNGNTLSFKETGRYSYTVWGEWAQTGGLKTDINSASGLNLAAAHNNWIVGEVTKDLPTQGSATYSGDITGTWYTAGDLGNPSNRPNYGGKIHGSMNMTVNFTNTSIVAGTLNIQKQDNSTFATATMDNMQINRNTRAFSGRLIGSSLARLQSNTTSGGTSYNNQINGSFYGPNAEEVGGTWKVSSSSNEYASGIFAGKR